MALLAVVAAVMVQTIGQDPGRIGQDFAFYRDVGDRWLSSGQLYLPHQLTGDYQLALMVDVLYPPTSLLLFVPLALLPGNLDALFWWGVPALVLCWQIMRSRPSVWTWPLAGLLLLWPRSYGSVLWGNTDLWVMAAVSAGLMWGWPAVLTALKPSLAPLALLGARHRSWWLGLALLGVFSAAFLPLWVDYVTALRSVKGLGIDYSLFNVPIALIPLVLHLGRRRAPGDQATSEASSTHLRRPRAVPVAVQPAVPAVFRRRA